MHSGSNITPITQTLAQAHQNRASKTHFLRLHFMESSVAIADFMIEIGSLCSSKPLKSLGVRGLYRAVLDANRSL